MPLRSLLGTALLLVDARELACDRNAFSQTVYDTANAFSPPVTDKFTTHAFETIYGMFLLPLRFARNRPQILQLKKSCDNGAMRVWRELLPRAELFTATGDGPCPSEERPWTDGRRFDIIIDDQYRADDQIVNSFDKLWPLLKPGGVFIVENPVGVAVEQIKSWTDQLVTIDGGAHKDRYPLPAQVLFVTCQLEGCAIGKQFVDSPARVLHAFDTTSTAIVNSHSCDKAVFVKKFFDLATSLNPVTDKVTVHACECLVCAHRSVAPTRAAPCRLETCAHEFISLRCSPRQMRPCMACLSYRCATPNIVPGSWRLASAAAWRTGRAHLCPFGRCATGRAAVFLSLICA